MCYVRGMLIMRSVIVHRVWGSRDETRHLWDDQLSWVDAGKVSDESRHCGIIIGYLENGLPYQITVDYSNDLGLEHAALKLILCLSWNSMQPH